MKIGTKLLYTNGRGNYRPLGKMVRTLCGKLLRKDPDNKFAKNDLKSLSHHSYNGNRKGLNSKIRHMLKNELNNEINNE